MLEPLKINTINTIGLFTLVKREVDRFLNVYMQTIVAPVITTLLFYTIFALAFGGIARQVGDVPFLEFLAPGLIMMTMVMATKRKAILYYNLCRMNLISIR